MTEASPDPTPQPPNSGDASGAPNAPAPQTARTYKSEELFEGRREVFIEHGRAVYRLRITSQGRLILTK